MNKFIKLLLETLHITEEQTKQISDIMFAYDIKPCIMRDVLQPAMRGETNVGEQLVSLMLFKAKEIDEKEKSS